MPPPECNYRHDGDKPSVGRTVLETALGQGSRPGAAPQKGHALGAPGLRAGQLPACNTPPSSPVFDCSRGLRLRSGELSGRKHGSPRPLGFAAPRPQGAPATDLEVGRATRSR